MVVFPKGVKMTKTIKIEVTADELAMMIRGLGLVTKEIYKDGGCDEKVFSDITEQRDRVARLLGLWKPKE